MKNRKLKGKNAAINMIAREYYDCTERNVCAVYLALLDMGVSKIRLYELDEHYHEITVPKFQRDADEGLIYTKIDRFLQEVKMSRAEIEVVPSRFAKKLSRVFCTLDSLAPAMTALYVDFVMLLYELHTELGYGRKRILRVIDHIMSSTVDEKKEVEEQLHIFYPDPMTIPDTTNLYTKQRRAQFDKTFLQQKKTELEAVRMLQKEYSK